jgi:hypothetical protein
VLWIRDILVWIRIHGSIPRSTVPESDPVPDLDPAVFVSGWQDANTVRIYISKSFCFLLLYLWKVHLKQSLKIKVKRSHKIVEIKGFLLLLVSGRIRNCTNNNGSRSGRPKNIQIIRFQIRIGIHYTGSRQVLKFPATFFTNWKCTFTRHGWQPINVKCIQLKCGFWIFK